MPVKFSKSQVKVDRNTKKVTIEHDYIDIHQAEILVNTTKMVQNLNSDRKSRMSLVEETREDCPMLYSSKSKEN